MNDKKNPQKSEESLMIKTAGIMGMTFSLLVAILVLLWIEFPPLDLIVIGLGGVGSPGLTLIFTILFSGAFALLLIMVATLREYSGKIAGWLEVVLILAGISIIAQLMLSNWVVTGASLGLSILFTYYLYKAQDQR